MEKPTLEQFGITEEDLYKIPAKKFSSHNKSLEANFYSFTVIIGSVLTLLKYKQLGPMLGASVLLLMFGSLISKPLLKIADFIEDRLLLAYFPHFLGVKKYVFAYKKYSDYQDATIKEANKRVDEVINAYGRCLEETENLPSTTNMNLRDISDLPYPKEVIKKALKIKMKQFYETQDKNALEVCLTCFLMLSDFQEDLPEGKEFSRSNPMTSDEMLEFGQGFAASEAVRTKAYQEQLQLREELRELGYWTSKDDESVRKGVEELSLKHNLPEL